jgi:hypothetical protein
MNGGRVYSEEKQQTYLACLRVMDARPKVQRNDRILLQEAVDATGMERHAVANALKWLKRKGLATTVYGKDGWVIKRVQAKRLEKFCWRHGLYKEEVGRGKNKRWVCGICERNPFPESEVTDGDPASKV